MKVLVAGDFAPQARAAKQIIEKQFSEVFSEDCRKVINSADFSFVNFECPIVEEGYKPISKCGPNLQCTPEAAEAVKFAGFTGVTMANNHILDFGSEGLYKSVECCKDMELDVIGVGNNLSDAEKVLYCEKDGEKLAVINCCEHEFSIATTTDAGANPLNPIRQFYAIQDAKKNADYVLVIVHGGHEHYQLPSPRMVETYRFFIDAGADAVVNHHQHCYSGYETYKGKPIVYGLGNFCFDDPNASNVIWNEGYMVILCFCGDAVALRTIPYIQGSQHIGIKILVERYKFDRHILKLNKIISDTNQLKDAHNKWMLSFVKRYALLFEPYNGRISKGLFVRGLLPSFISRKKMYQVVDFVECESHLDCLRYTLRSLIK